MKAEQKKQMEICSYYIKF